LSAEDKLINQKLYAILMTEFFDEWEIKKALRPKKKTNKKTKARVHANKAKVLLHLHKKRKPSHHSKVVVKK
jgi:hypothetical protein